MKNFKILTLGCAALLVGCQQASEMEQIDEELLVSIEATINDSGSRIDSRYSSSDETPNNLEFDEDDSIGLFMEGKELVQWTKTQSGWDSAKNLYWTNKTLVGIIITTFNICTRQNTHSGSMSSIA